MRRYRLELDVLDDPTLVRDDHGDVIRAEDFEAYQCSLHDALREFGDLGPDSTPVIRAIQAVYDDHAPCEKCRAFTDLDADSLCHNCQEN